MNRSLKTRKLEHRGCSFTTVNNHCGSQPHQARPGARPPQQVRYSFRDSAITRPRPAASRNSIRLHDSSPGSSNVQPLRVMCSNQTASKPAQWNGFKTHHFQQKL